MGLAELFFFAVALSMDAFAVSVCKGLSLEKLKIKHTVIAGAYFGGFQALMPLLGYLLGSRFQQMVEAVDHWIAFSLLLLLGINMIREAVTEQGGEADASFAFRSMFPLAIATSIDALAAGITFAFLRVNIGKAVILIGCTTFLFSAAGIKIGHVFGNRFQKKAQIAGGVILILIGIRILWQHLGAA